MAETNYKLFPFIHNNHAKCVNNLIQDPLYVDVTLTQIGILEYKKPLIGNINVYSKYLRKRIYIRMGSPYN